MGTVHIKYATDEIIRPRAEKKYPILVTNGFKISHAAGVDRSQILAVRAGMRDSNDLVWIGRAAAVAAKLSSVRGTRHRSFITNDVYARLREDVKKGPKGEDMWERMPGIHHGQVVYRSTWQWKP
jgi:hypothetical protein